MNLFYLDEDHDVNAFYHIDKHCVKMPLEVAEMLCMAHVVNDVLGYIPRTLTPEERSKVDKVRKAEMALGPPETRTYPYVGRLAHYNHPCTIWVRSSLENYNWTFCYGHAVDTERQKRNNHNNIHKAMGLMYKFDAPNKLKNVGLTKFALAMKDFIKSRPDLCDENDPIKTYRNFYQYDKASFASWKHGVIPSWWQPESL